MTARTVTRLKLCPECLYPFHNGVTCDGCGAPAANFRTFWEDEEGHRYAEAEGGEQLCCKGGDGDDDSDG
jgi:hypothetical protein